MAVVTLLDLMNLHAPASLERKIVDETYLSAPLFNKLPSRVISGTTYKYQKRDTLPKIGARPVNAGADVHKAAIKTENAECYYYDGRIEVDKALIDAEPDNKHLLMADNAKATIKGTMFGLEQGLFYKTPYGINPLRSQIADYMAISADPAITDESAWTAGGTSVWLLHVDDDSLRLNWGNRKTLQFGAIRDESVMRNKADGTPGYMQAKVQNCNFWLGFEQMNEFASGVILNVSAANPLTDELLAKACDLFPAAMRPNLIVMNPGARSLLRSSRSKALTYVKGGKGGQTAYAETPTEWDGIPILVTDGILADETPEKIAEAVGQTAYTADDLKQKNVGITNPNNKSKV
jgi:hypothetical protein